MPVVPIEWIDPQEFAAIEDALAAAEYCHSQIARESAKDGPSKLPLSSVIGSFFEITDESQQQAACMTSHVAHGRGIVTSHVFTDSSQSSKGGAIDRNTGEIQIESRNQILCRTSNIARESADSAFLPTKLPLGLQECERTTVSFHTVADSRWSSEAEPSNRVESEMHRGNNLFCGTTDIARECTENVSSSQRFPSLTCDNVIDRSTVSAHAVRRLFNRKPAESTIESQSLVVCRSTGIARERTGNGFSPAKLRRRLPSWTYDDACGKSNQNLFTMSFEKMDVPACFPPENNEESKSEEGHLNDQTPPWRIVRFGCQKSTKCKLPLLQFKGRIVYSNATSDTETHSLKLLQIIEARRGLQGAPVPVGFDTEWKVVYRRGATPRKVAVLQLCVDANQCDIFHIVHSGISCHLHSLLEDPSIHKVGIGAHGDAAKLHRDYGVNVKGVVDLCTLANHKLRGSTGSSYVGRNWSLSALAEELTGKQVDKVPSIRTGNWEACPLSAPQLQYAATDAFASLHLFQILMTFQDPVIMESMKEDTNNVA